MTEKELEDYQDLLKKLKEARRANETPEQGMAHYAEFIKESGTSRTSDTLKQIQEKIVAEELKHIPDWPDPQGELRMIYHSRRMNSLGKKAKAKQTAKKVLEDCIAHLKANYPDFQFKYNEDFFNKCGSI